MRHRIYVLTTVLACVGALPARAQVATDPRALDNLKPSQTDTTPPAPRAAPQRPLRAGPQATSRGSPKGSNPGRGSATPATASVYGPPRPPPPAPLPPVPPPGPVIPAPIAVPTRPTPPPAPVPIVQTAPGEALPIKDGLRVTFGAGRSDLNPLTDGALRTLVHSVPPFDTTFFTVTSTAALEAEDPSTPRRLALSRALAVRSVLIAEGIASPRIIVRVVGGAAPTADEPADRVDVVAATHRPDAAASASGAGKP